MLPRRPFLYLSCFAVLLAAPAYAAISLDIANTSVSAGGKVQVDIAISSDSPPEDLTEYELVLQLSPINGTGDSSLSFVNPQGQDFINDPNYVFVGTSDVLQNGGTPFTYDSATQITVIDLSVDAFFDPVPVEVTGTPRLLAQVELMHNLGTTSAAATVGDQYTISVSDLSGFFDDFLELDFNEPSATIDITAAAIPEPSFAGLFAFGAAGIALSRRHRSAKR